MANSLNTPTSDRPLTFGRYSLLEKIGQGGMADVFRAKSYGVEGFEKVLVIKRILPTLAREPRFVEMFVREAKLSVRLSHANVVQVFDLGRVGDALFIAMEYVHGLDLATLLAWCRKRGEPLPIAIAGYVAAEVAKGLDHAHRRRDEQMRPLGIVHRDVSPQNVLLSYEGEVKVTDFGIAKAKDTLGADDEAPQSDGKIAIRGKYAYLSPEQANGKPVDARSDIWALGVVMYEMIAGTNPFAAPTTFETLRRVRAAEAPPLELARADVPRELANIVRKCLALDPDERYLDAARLHDDLLAFLYSSGERFGAHALGEVLFTYRERDSSKQPAGDLPDVDVDVEEGLVNTPVEVPDASDVVTAPPRGSVGSITGSHPDATTGGIARAASLGEHREVTALVVELGDDRAHSMAADDRARTRGSQEAAAILERYGAHIVEREDARLAALFGVSDPDGRDTELAVRCALVLARSLGEAAPGASIGVHAARVILHEGAAVDDERLARLLDGARELSRAREGRIAISNAALRHVRATIDAEPIPDASSRLAGVNGVLVKGRKPPQELYAKFVGRREELRILGEIFAAATRRRARIVTLQGGAGLGKTRLLHEVARRLQRGGYDVGWYMTSCPVHGRDVPLSGAAAMLRVLCGIQEGDAAARIDAVRPRLRALGLGNDELRTVLDLVRTGGDFHGTGEIASRQEHAAAALAHMISRLCDDRLHVLAWDDAQALDSLSRAMLASVARAVASCRVVFVFATVDDTPSMLAPVSGPQSDPRPVQQHLLALQDLARDEVGKLVATRLGVKEVAGDLLSFIVDRAGGNPLHVEELLRAMQDAGAIAKVVEPPDASTGRGAYERAIGRRLASDASGSNPAASALAPIDLPKSLKGLVSSRLARLGATERAILLTIALVGEPAEVGILAAVAALDVPTLDRTLATLESAGVLRVAERSVRFVSPVAREVVLDAAPIEAKRELHAAIAAALVGLPGTPDDRIAHHLLEGGDRERAADHFARSGDKLVAAGRPDSAAADLTRALVVSDLRTRPRVEVARWLAALATALSTSRGGHRNLADVSTALDRALARIELDGDRTARRDALIDVGRSYGAISHFDAARDAFDRAEDLADEDVVLRRVLMARVETARRAGQFGDAARILARLEPLVGAANEGDTRAREGELHDVLVALGLALTAQSGEAARDHALALLDRADALVARIDDTSVRRFDRLKSRMFVHYFSRQFREAASINEKIIELARDNGLLFETGIALHNLGDAKLHLHEHAAAYAALQQSLALAEEAGSERLAAINRAPITYLDGLAGDAAAIVRLSDLASWDQTHGYEWDELNARYWLGLLHLAKKAKGAAVEELSRGRALAEKLAMRQMVVDCDEALDRARALSG